MGGLFSTSDSWVGGTAHVTAEYAKTQEDEMGSDRRCVVGEDVVTVEVVDGERWERASVVEGGKGGTGAMRERTI